LYFFPLLQGQGSLRVGFEGAMKGSGGSRANSDSSQKPMPGLKFRMEAIRLNSCSLVARQSSRSAWSWPSMMWRVSRFSAIRRHSGLSDGRAVVAKEWNRSLVEDPCEQVATVVFLVRPGDEIGKKAQDFSSGFLIEGEVGELMMELEGSQAMRLESTDGLMRGVEAIRGPALGDEFQSLRADDRIGVGDGGEGFLAQEHEVRPSALRRTGHW